MQESMNNLTEQKQGLFDRVAYCLDFRELILSYLNK